MIAVQILILHLSENALKMRNIQRHGAEMEPGRPGHGSTFWAGSGRVTGQCPIHMTRSFDPDSALQKCTFCLLVRCHCQLVWLKRHG